MKKMFLGVVTMVLLASCAPQMGDAPAGGNGSGNIILSKGAENAPILVEEYADFQCPACKLFQQGTMVALQRDYISTGKVKFIFRDFPLIEVHPKAMLTHNAAWCAADQGKTDDMIAFLYEKQDDMSEEGLKNKAKELGMNADTFASCVSGNTHKAHIMANRNLGMSKGVNSTPTLFVNGKKVKSANDYANVKKVIDAELEAAVK